MCIGDTPQMWYTYITHFYLLRLLSLSFECNSQCVYVRERLKPNYGDCKRHVHYLVSETIISLSYVYRIDAACVCQEKKWQISIFLHSQHPLTDSFTSLRNEIMRINICSYEIKLKYFSSINDKQKMSICIIAKYRLVMTKQKFM